MKDSVILTVGMIDMCREERKLEDKLRFLNNLEDNLKSCCIRVSEYNTAKKYIDEERKETLDRLRKLGQTTG